MKYDDFTVVLPTLNEEKTVGILINRLLKSYKGLHIMVVDDGSSDSTRRVVEEISKKNRNVRFFDRSGKARGLTASIVDGILGCRTRFAVVMDADLQHPAQIVGRVAKKLSDGSELVIATRADVKGWELHRKIISKSLIGMGYALLVIGNRERSRDIFSGFFGVERKLFERVYRNNRDRFIGGGYKVLFDFLKSIKYRSITIDEVPYAFGLRKHGTSKAGFRQGIYLFKSFFT